MKSRKAFTMIELIFVIVVIGILATIAVPKLAMNRNDAIIAKAKATVSAVRSALATERQKRILRGNFTKIYQLSSSSAVNSPIFDAFDGNTSNPVLEYGPLSCETAGRDGCWEVTTLGTVGGTAVYAFNMPMTGTAVVFTLDNNRFDCTASDENCRKLTQ